MAALGDQGDYLGGRDIAVSGTGGTVIAATVWDAEGERGRERPPAVLLHGLSQQRRFWGPVVRRLPGERLAAVDLRGHGDSGKPDAGPYDVPTCARDVLAVLDATGWASAVVVGHSWGAAVALQVAALAPDRVSAAVALDGGTTSLADLGPREDVRARLEPPRIAVPQEDLVPLLRGGALGDCWSDEVEQALLPTFETRPDGLIGTRIGFDRHMLVLDGMLDQDVDSVLAGVRCTTWVVSCEAAPADRPGGEHPHDQDDLWRQAKERGWARASVLLERPRLMLWAGAVHDVPLQWPSLVAGLVRTAIDERGSV